MGDEEMEGVCGCSCGAVVTGCPQSSSLCISNRPVTLDVLRPQPTTPIMAHLTAKCEPRQRPKEMLRPRKR